MLHTAVVAHASEEMLGMLIQRCSHRAVDNMGWTPLHVAAMTGNVVAATMLCEQGASLHAKDIGGVTTLEGRLHELRNPGASALDAAPLRRPHGQQPF